MNLEPQSRTSAAAPRMDMLSLRDIFTRRKVDPILKQNKDFFKSFDHTKRLVECDFTVLDTELTGMSVRQDEIVSIGAVRIKDLNIAASDTFYSLVQPKQGVPKTSTLIHRITPEQLVHAPRLRQILPKFMDYLDGTLIVGHHIGMDMSFLNSACRTVFGGKLANPCIDTMRLAMVYDKECWENYYDQFNLNISYNLNELAKRLEIPQFGAHNALQDAMQTAYLFLFLVRKLRQGGIETLKDLYLAGRAWRWYF